MIRGWIGNGKRWIGIGKGEGRKWEVMETKWERDG